MNVRERAILHFEKYKLVYAAAGCVLLGADLAGITAYMMKGCKVVITTHPVGEKPRLDGDTMRQLYDHLSGQRCDATTSVGNSQVVSNSVLQNSHIGPVYNYPAKRLSYIVSQDGTDNWWRSQSEAAKALGISEPRISSHLNHGDPLGGGISLIRQGITS